MKNKKNNFWQKLSQPILALAPMAGVTDSAFRQICLEYGADVLYSEMASATALVYGQNKTLELLKRFKKEKPYVVQLFGSNPEHFAQAVKIVEKEIKPEGIDINFGCPVKKVTSLGAGSKLMQNLELSRTVISACLNNTKLPISIKVRTRSGKMGLLEFLKGIKDLNISALMIHGRTLEQGFVGEIDYKIIKEAKKYFKGIILANGGINDVEEAQKTLHLTQVNGLGLGRGALGKPWLFKEIKKELSKKTLPKELLKKKTPKKDSKILKKDSFEKVTDKKVIINAALKHSKLIFKLKGESGIMEMRKHLCWYIQGFAGAKKIREQLVKVKTLKEIENILKRL